MSLPFPRKRGDLGFLELLVGIFMLFSVFLILNDS